MASKGDKDGPKKKDLFHFTDPECAKKIATSGKIKQSSTDTMTRDAVFGDGVYATSLKPNKNTVSTIATNNWDDGTLPQQKIKQGKMDVAFQIQVSEDRVEKAQGTSRNVYVVKGDISKKDIKDVHVKDKSGKYVSLRGKKD